MVAFQPLVSFKAKKISNSYQTLLRMKWQGCKFIFFRMTLSNAQQHSLQLCVSAFPCPSKKSCIFAYTTLFVIRSSYLMPFLFSFNGKELLPQKKDAKYIYFCERWQLVLRSSRPSPIGRRAEQTCELWSLATAAAVADARKLLQRRSLGSKQ